MHKKIFIFSIVLFAGCTTVGPIDQPHFIPMVEKASGVSGTHIALSGRVSWVQTNTDFCWIANASLNILLQAPFINCTKEQIQNTNKISNFPTEKAPPNKEGVLVVSDAALTLLDWDKEANVYVKAGAFAISSISALELHKFGLSRLMRLTVSNSEFKYYTMTLMGNQGQQQDFAKNDLLFDHIKSRLANHSKVVLY